ncbi:MAG: 1-(5-phosphoribosyl)-5-[(5-phosphoribosylamino)methylideneamino]imidazole-4-carboxamide isomerase [Candidatus Omnitrophica bacterium]|nr:1-(5-phosphoribosyl)-5-[(5-phosphoribosylamino)methylideneamino]imidazole-4-carboxamide isomerase [Candidatus Omnitrophota bacterium]
MIIFPAIDIKDGKVVRLRQGEFSDVTEYSLDPLNVAQKWVDAGAQWIHIVDLDGALHGEMKNFEIIAKIAKEISIPIEMGGGVRGEDEIIKLIDAGVKRVILGTRVVQDRTFLRKIIEKFGDKIAVSLDCKDGKVTQKGWTETTKVKGTDFAKELENLGLQCLIYTDIKRDGMLTGPNWEALSEILNTVTVPVIASGGISNIADIKKLLTIQPRKVLGVITGKAIYEGKLDLKEAITIARSPQGDAAM